MTDKILAEIRAVSRNMKNAILRPLTVYRARRLVEVTVVTDSAFTPEDKASVSSVVRKYVPEYYECNTEITKLSPDCGMVKSKIFDAVCACSKAVFATITENDITVEKTEDGFLYKIFATMSLVPENFCKKINDYLEKCYCGRFSGECVASGQSLEDLEVEEYHDEPEFEIPLRTFKIRDFEFLEGEIEHKQAVYLADLNFTDGDVTICGVIDDLRERSFINKKGQEKNYLSIALNDTTATAYITYFMRQKSADKIKELKAGDSIVCSGASEDYKGNRRFTAKFIDKGKIPERFVPEKRASKPVPLYYRTVKPEPFSDAEQTDLFDRKIVPDCLKGKSFVVFDLETTGLNSSPVSGNMDKIIEIGAFKIEDGEITQSFSTFINPGKKLSDEIIALTGITEGMVANAPAYEEVMPDFYKFCAGSVLVGHNIAGFDFKFVDYYCANLGYILERTIIDTYPLAQELLFLSNYKLNTVAEKFNITFNHHRAIDDALATAKIFIELIKIKKSLPKYQ